MNLIPPIVAKLVVLPFLTIPSEALTPGGPNRRRLRLLGADAASGVDCLEERDRR